MNLTHRNHASFCRMSLFLVWGLVLAVGQPTTFGQEADLIVRGGTIRTMDAAQPSVEALAVKDDRIMALGTLAQINARAGADTDFIELDGRTVVPGFIESHAHLTGLGGLLMDLNLTEASSWEEIVEMVAAAARGAEPGQWIVGRGWHQSLWDKPPVPSFDGYPSHQDLSAVSPNNPVLLVHRSGHMSMSNQSAMDAAGISRGTPDPDGGEILHDPAGEPIGVFRETAQGLVRAALARDREAMSAVELQREFERQVELAEQECLKHGVTTFVDAGMSPGQVKQLARLIESGRLDLRMWVMLRTSNRVLEREMEEMKKLQGFANHHLTVGGIKQMLDGALGAHGAWLLEPYSDLPESSGLNVTPLSVIEGTAEIAYENELQLCVHAIGDRANREMLDLFESYVSKDDSRELRWRIEHAQHLHPEDIPRFGELGVIASMQAVHCTSDGPFVPDRLGPIRSANGAYAWKSLLDSGAVIANGTDAPVEPVDPLISFRSSVTRAMKNGQPFYSEQAMTREQALRSYTSDAAFAIFEEQRRGSLQVGMLADFVVLNDDILTVAEPDLESLRVEITVVAGRIVYQLSDQPELK